MNILFITHETSRTGAPHVILYFMEWLRSQKTEHKLYLVSLHKGTISSEFKKLADGFIEMDDLVRPNSLGLKTQLLQKARMYKKKSIKEQWSDLIAAWDVDLIYANTILSIPFAIQVKEQKGHSKIIAHIHELEAIIQMKLPNLHSLKDKIDHFITPAPLVSENLHLNHKINESCISTVPECSKITDVVLNKKSDNSNTIFTIGGSGTVHWRKGTDLFIQIARLIHHKLPDAKVKFLWLGHISTSERIIIEEDLKKMGVFNIVEFIGSVANPQDFYKDMDVFLMTSREDPFPLVCIEVGMMGIPIVYFGKAIGTQYVLEKAGGKKVAYLDVNAMTNAVIDYYNNRQQLIEDGEKNIKAFSGFTPDKVCPSYYEVCKSVLGYE